MATVIRPPFWVPRPADDFPYYKFPYADGTLRLLTEQTPAKKRWQPHYPPYDDAGTYNISPQDSAIIAQLTHQHVYGRGGQVSTPTWADLQYYDDITYWYAQPRRSWIIPELTQGGILKAKNYAPYVVDDQPVWWGSPLAADTLYLLTAGGKPSFKRWSPYVVDDQPVWSGSPLASDLLVPILTAGGQVTARQWLYGYDDAVPWLPPVPINSNVLQVKINPVIPLVWRFGSQDDPATWQGRLLASDVIVMLTTGGQPQGVGGRFYGWDDAAFWQSTLQRNNAALAPGPAPFIPLIDRFVSYDDPATWEGSPLAAEVIPLLTQGGQPEAVRGRFYGYDDASFWQEVPPRNNALLVPPPSVFIPLLPRFSSYDDPAFWYSSPLHASTLDVLIAGGSPFVPEILRFTGYDDSAFWQGSPQPDRTMPVLATGARPIIPAQWLFNSYDETASWQRAAYPNLSPAGPAIPAVPRIWIYGGPGWFAQDDAGTWYARPLRSQLMLDLAARPFSVTYQTGAVQGNYDAAETAWAWAKPYDITLLTAALPFMSQAAFFNRGAFGFAYDSGETSWSWTPPLAWANYLPAPPPPPTGITLKIMNPGKVSLHWDWDFP